MKKLVFLVGMLAFVLGPLVANATLLGSGSLNVYWSTPKGGGYYLDYDGEVVHTSFGYTTGLDEIFCVSGNDANSLEDDISFFTITPDLDTLIGDGTYNKLSKAAWIADHWTEWGTSDVIKGEAQKAVWAIIGLMDILEGSGTDYDIYVKAQSINGYHTNMWYLADSAEYQDYLTPAPVPEPATMLLFGVGLCGLAFVGRKKLIRERG